jgi:glutathione S-transferase
MYVLYVIPGSHACRSAMLMLEHKRSRYRRVDIPTLMHPLVVRLRGFDAGGQRRTAGERRPLPLRMGDLLGTVPALACETQRISTNYRIARFLDARHPDAPLVPADRELRVLVEEAERWANNTLQMAARRILLPAVLRDPAGFSRSTADGRMGYLLYRSAVARRLICPWIGRLVFAVALTTKGDEIAELPSLLDRIDGWIADGVIGGAELNVADFMIAPSLALILCRSECRPFFEGRPALELVDRLLPEPTHERRKALA